MILRELFYFNKEDSDMPQDDDRYDSSKDHNVMNHNDTRKIRLTLKQINQLRRASDQHYLDQERDVESISTMYAQPPAEPTA
jgi:hypothetical protein